MPRYNDIGGVKQDGNGQCSREDATKILDFFYEMAANFIDTANAYQDEKSKCGLGNGWLPAKLEIPRYRS